MCNKERSSIGHVKGPKTMPLTNTQNVTKRQGRKRTTRSESLRSPFKMDILQMNEITVTAAHDAVKIISE